jgi:hypothetical protein
MTRKRYDVVPFHGRWAVESGGGMLGDYDLKQSAIDAAVERAQDYPGDAQVLIHRADGTIEDERTYGHDPYPPKG